MKCSEHITSAGPASSEGPRAQGGVERGVSTQLGVAHHKHMTRFLRSLALLAIGLVIFCPNAWGACADQVAVMPVGPAAAVDLEGDLVALGQGLELRLIQLADPNNPELLGAVTLPGVIAAVDLSDDLVLAATGTSGLQVIDVSEPSAPIVVGELISELALAVDVKRRGNHAYLLEIDELINGVSYTLRVIDVTDPAAPTEMGSYAAHGSGKALALGNGGEVYVAVSSKVVMVDVSSLEQPVEVDGVFGLTNVRDVVVSGDVLIAVSDSAVHFFDISDPSQMHRLSRFDDEEGVALAVADGYAFVVGQGPGVRILDVHDPAQPVEVQGLAATVVGRDIVVSDGLVLVAAGGPGLLVADVSDTTAVRELARLQSSEAARWLTVAGDILIVANKGYEEPRLVDIRQSPPVDVGSLPTSNYIKGRPVATGDLVFVQVGVPSSPDAISVFDISSPGAPKEIGRGTVSQPRGLALAGSYLYVVDSYSQDFYGLFVVDVADPSEPVVVGSLQMPVDHSGSLRSVAVEGTRAYVGQSSCPFLPGCYSALRVVDVSDPTAPHELGMYGGIAPLDIAIRGTMAYVVAGNSLSAIDFSDPAAPDLIAWLEVGPVTGSLELEGRFAFVTTAPCPRGACRGGLSVIDISDPRQPVVFARFDSPGSARDVAVVGGVAWIADGDAGIVAVDIASCGLYVPRRGGRRSGSP